MPIPTQAQYEQNERRLAAATLAEIERAPLADRQAARAEWLEAMRDRPDLVAERIDWLLEGNYGFGPMIQARQILAMGPRSNKVAGLCQLIAAFEWRCPRGFAADAWNKLYPTAQKRLAKAVERVLGK